MKNQSYALIKFLDLDTNPVQKDKYLTLFIKIYVNAFDINAYGMGLFQPANFLNHSCEPNCGFVLH